MSKYFSVIVGIVLIFIGIIGLVSWWEWFLHGIQAIGPAILILGGVIAVFAGASEIKDSAAQKKQESK